WMLPDSGIIYATREDALPDASDKAAKTPIDEESDDALNLALHELARDRISPTDFWLDPTRRPSAIMLVNGSQLGRGGSNEFEDEEKGLILATNLPAYIKGQFNVHDEEEFEEELDTNWDNFYDRSANDLNENFACRQDDPRLPDCNVGDNWRAVSVLADSLTLLSDNFRFGFRNEGDYDLRNNQTDNLFRSISDSGYPNSNIPVDNNIQISKKRLDNGFWDNTFATNGLSSDNDSFEGGTAYQDDDYSTRNNEPLFSSYFTNFVTPVQRRLEGPEYVMETCRKLPVSECLPSDWVVGYDANNNGNLWKNDEELETFKESGVDINGNGKTNDVLVEAEITSEQLFRIGTVNRNRLGAGTTAAPPKDPKDQRYPRRVAFKRYSNSLVLDNELRPTPLGIDSSGNVDEFPYSNFPDGTINGNTINQPKNSLWFRTANAENPDDPSDRGDADEFTFKDHPLFYLAASPELDDYEANPALDGYYDDRDRWLLPDMKPLNSDIEDLNDDEAAYTICVDGAGQSQEAQVTKAGLSGSGCSVDSAVNALSNAGSTTNKDLNTSIQLGEGDKNPDEVNNFLVYNYKVTSKLTDHGVGDPDPDGDPATDDGEKQNFIHIGSTDPSKPITITLKGDEDSIFILQPSEDTPVLFQNVQLILDGVTPNQVFWLSNKGMAFAGENTLAGNFLAKDDDDSLLVFDTNGDIEDSTGYPYTPANTEIRGGRFLGFGGTGGTFNEDGTAFDDFKTVLDSDVAINAITTTRQPLLVPVLQTNRPEGDGRPFPFKNANTPENTDQFFETYWMPLPPDTDDNIDQGTFNLIMAVGDSPARYRADSPGRAEINGAVSNLTRFLENWSDDGKVAFPVKIQGSFIQLQRSSYSTAPFWQLTPRGPGGVDDENQGSFLGYSQRYAFNGKHAQYYTPPERQFGFDVGLLSQLPDLFAQRFTLPPTSDPNEYYREVGRNDDWIQALLCGVQMNGNNPTNNQAVNTEYRPEQCDTDL
ncbi:MAG: hypothetical protein F6K03_03730, partial [Kamptonema sp. SIO4C4]|nr:hypothetical protein [Kamptonema sp. SIO4C4]